MIRFFCFFGHHRSASSWTKAVLQSVGDALGWRYATIHNAAMFGHDLSRYCETTPLDLLTFSNAKWAYVADLPPFLGVHLVRDPRDVLVSAYFSHRNSHPTEQWPELIPHRAQLQACSLEEGLLSELACREEQFADMLTWVGNEQILELKMEALTHDPAVYFTQLMMFWGLFDAAQSPQLEQARWRVNRILPHLKLGRLPRWKGRSVHANRLGAILDSHQFRHKSGGRAIGEANSNHHYRMGVAGNWRDYFFPELTQEFKRRYNDVLLKWGYETTEDWTV